MWRVLDNYGAIKTTKGILGFKTLEEKYIKTFSDRKDVFSSLSTDYGNSLV